LVVTLRYIEAGGYGIVVYMPHISRKRVKKNIFKRMTNEFINTISGLKTRDDISGFLRELLTPTERVMLAKRLAIIMMLKRGYSFRAIEKALKVSPSTSSRFWKMTKTQPFDVIMKGIKTKEEKKKFWEEIERLLRMGLPPRGRGRWTNVMRMLDKP